MINEDRTMVGSLGEEMCVTSDMTIASLVYIFLFPVTNLFSQMCENFV